ncbi:EAL domain-containing protein [Leptolyngbya sp. FACHB-36]|uniref:bifunctional diguanylate cyclase/phosphodiesterase n=1 Tax=Leptolyngbya sp. FACHB-36 TaxID=2692808 RepID=UPI001680FE45|nr:EAL domain-containing protein [Leptolyngbya sp. FACHB-36]MBD2020655.1 EAL domain-containing protein [Leptolyngbya sp. FACHB-36]
MSKPRLNQESLLHRITNRIRQSLELQEILMTAAQEIRVFLDIDRVKIYRFESDGSGEVIAEAIKDKRLPSLLGLHFPAGDIPSQSRDLFLRARQRVIVDVVAQRKILSQLDNLQTGDSLSLEDVRYAPVDPCHVQYLQAMGVLASLIIPILHQNRLWGLVAIHHAKPRRFHDRELQMVQLLVDQVSIAIAQSNLLKQVQQQAHHEATINRISSLLHCPLTLPEIRQTVLEETVKALQGSGGRLYLGAEPANEPAQLYTTGVQPTEAFIEESAGWHEYLGWHESSNVAHTTHQELIVAWEQAGRSLLPSTLADYSSPTANPSGLPSPCILADLQLSQWCLLADTFSSTPIRSVLIIPLQYRHQGVGWLSIFRNGYDTEVLWAGRHNADERNQYPRRSFEAWREVKVDQSPEWSQDEVKLAQTIALHLYMATMQKRVESLLRHEASHDRLTNLPNRLLFDEQLSLALLTAQQRGEMLAAAFLDLDRFKTVNDTLGHAVGDQLLKQVTQRLQGCLRQCDTVARWGGDEFTLLFPHISIDEVSKIARQILDVLGAPIHLERQELYISASLGIALFPYDGEDAETLLKNADTAMYRAKQQGRNNFQLYSPEMNTKAREQLELETDLRKALARNEFLLYYQPQVDIHTGSIVSAEALVRWQHPQLGLVPPNQFIPLAEETGLICPLGEWVIRAACIQHQAWRSLGLPPLRIAVNLSARQFQQQDLVKIIASILQETKTEPHYLELEITESTVMQDVDFTIAVLQELREMGIQIAMDDFGTGYSSLNSIKHFPLHTLKIDQSFVRDLMTDSSDVAIARAIVALGKGLNLKVMAEGVETCDQLEFLRSLGCDGAQGYLFSRPLSPTAASELLAQEMNLSSRVYPCCPAA